MPELKKGQNIDIKRKTAHIHRSYEIRIIAFRSTEITEQCCESGSNRIRTFFPDPELFVLDPDPAKITD